MVFLIYWQNYSIFIHWLEVFADVNSENHTSNFNGFSQMLFYPQIKKHGILVEDCCNKSGQLWGNFHPGSCVYVRLLCALGVFNYMILKVLFANASTGVSINQTQLLFRAMQCVFTSQIQIRMPLWKSQLLLNDRLYAWRNIEFRT